MAMVLIDLEKTFDRVWTQGLFYKLLEYKVPFYLIKLLNSYLTNRKFKVKLNNTYSEIKTIKAGVPQGSVLGPKLFRLFINDIPKLNNSTNLAHADDTAIFAQSFNAEVANKKKSHTNAKNRKIFLKMENQHKLIQNRKYIIYQKIHS